MNDLPRPCRKCGSVVKHKDGRCQPCSLARQAANRIKFPGREAAYSAAFKLRHPERVKARGLAFARANKENLKPKHAAWYQKTKARHNELSAAWRKANPDKFKELITKWNAANPDARKLQTENRRARKLNSGGKLSVGLLQKLYKLQKGKCPCCKLSLGDDYHLDHIVALSKGGTHSDDNIQLLRATCNYSKGAKDPLDFMQQKGFLL